jgi:hypothetical protein
MIFEVLSTWNSERCEAVWHQRQHLRIWIEVLLPVWHSLNFFQHLKNEFMFTSLPEGCGVQEIAPKSVPMCICVIGGVSLPLIWIIHVYFETGFHCVAQRASNCDSSASECWDFRGTPHTQLEFFFFFFFGGTGFWTQSRHSITWATPLVHFALLILEMGFH